VMTFSVLNAVYPHARTHARTHTHTHARTHKWPTEDGIKAAGQINQLTFKTPLSSVPSCGMRIMNYNDLHLQVTLTCQEPTDFNLVEIGDSIQTDDNSFSGSPVVERTSSQPHLPLCT
jgi:hypothetical protein